MSDFPEYRKEVAQFFPACPLCQRKTIETQFNHDLFGRDYIFCSNCHARWHLNFLQGLEWAELIERGTENNGRMYLGFRREPAFWYNLIQDTPAKKMTESLSFTRLGTLGWTFEIVGVLMQVAGVMLYWQNEEFLLPLFVAFGGVPVVFIGNRLRKGKWI